MKTKTSLPYDPTAYDYPDIVLPNVWTVRHKIDAPIVANIEIETSRCVHDLIADPRICPGASVAVGVGSRGIANLQEVVRTVISELRSVGAKPFIVPAMGSHGGATAEGQIEILAGYGITLEGVGAEIRATMEVDQVGALEDGYPVYFDKFAHAADAVILVNRIKHHTDFQSEIESGLCKMAAIGLGKQFGAEKIHRYGADGLSNIIPMVGRKLVEETNIIGGIALIQNGCGETAEIHAVPAPQIGGTFEKDLLKRAKRLSPSLAFNNVDVLILDEMGKNISGAGMDTHVIGRVEMPSINEADWHGPIVRVVCVLGLTEESHGNAAGIGLADIISLKLYQDIDWGYTVTNQRTSCEGGVRRGKIPVVLETNEGVVRSAMGGCGRGDYSQIRMVRIRNTAFTTTLQITEPLLAEAQARSDIEIVSGPELLTLNKLTGL